MKMRIYDLAKLYDKGSDVIIAALAKAGVENKESPVCMINEEQVEKAIDVLGPMPKQGPTPEEIARQGEIKAAEDKVRAEEQASDTFNPAQQAKVAAMIDAALEKTKEANKPKQKAKSTWRPSRVLEVPEKFKDPAFVYRWVNTDKQGNYRKKLSEGWEVDMSLTKKMEPDVTIEEGKSIEGAMQVREMIVMRLPVEKAKARNQFYVERSENAVAEQERQFDKKVNGAYGDIIEKQVDV